MNARKKTGLTRRRLPLLVALASAVLIGAGSTTVVLPAGAVVVPSLAISQLPLNVSTPVHPQVFIAVGNSESMDGTLSGAIMLGSGSLSSTYSTLNSSSSP